MRHFSNVRKTMAGVMSVLMAVSSVSSAFPAYAESADSYGAAVEVADPSAADSVTINGDAVGMSQDNQLSIAIRPSSDDAGSSSSISVDSGIDATSESITSDGIAIETVPQSKSYVLRLDLQSGNGHVVFDEHTADEKTFVLHDEDDGSKFVSVFNADNTLVETTALSEDMPYACSVVKSEGEVVSVRAVADYGYSVSECVVSAVSDDGTTVVRPNGVTGFAEDTYSDFALGIKADVDKILTVGFDEADASMQVQTDIKIESIESAIALETEQSVAETEPAAEDTQVQTEMGITVDPVAGPAAVEETEPETEVSSAESIEVETERATKTDIVMETEASSEEDASIETMMEEAAVVEVETEAETEEDVSGDAVEIETEPEHFSEVAEGADELPDEAFASMRLIVLAREDFPIVDAEHLISTYRNLYVLQYDSVDQAKTAYLYYLDAVGILAVEPDMPLESASDEEKDDIDVSFLTEESAIGLLTSEDVLGAPAIEKGTIAVLDTGAELSDNVIGQVSLIDDTLVGGTHGQSVVDCILEEDAEAKILSVRVLNDNGIGSVSSVIAGIEYAVRNGASIINMSLATPKTLSSSVLEAEIEKVAAGGTVVVGAAGNDGMNASSYIPGCVYDAYIIGACDEQGNRIESSNFGETVDYLVKAENTSEAAAGFAGMVSAYGRNGVADLIGSKLFLQSDENASSSDFIQLPEGDVLAMDTDGDADYSDDDTSADSTIGDGANVDFDELKIKLQGGKSDGTGDFALAGVASGTGAPATGIRHASLTGDDLPDGLHHSSSYYDSKAYCVDPKKDCPKVATYTIGSDKVRDMTDTAIGKALMFLYGGPFYDKAPISGTYTMKDIMEQDGLTTSDQKFQATHYVLSAIRRYGWSTNWNDSGKNKGLMLNQWTADYKREIKKLVSLIADYTDYSSSATFATNMVGNPSVSYDNGKMIITAQSNIVGPLLFDSATYNTATITVSDGCKISIDNQASWHRSAVANVPGGTYVYIDVTGATRQVEVVVTPNTFTWYRAYMLLTPEKDKQDIVMPFWGTVPRELGILPMAHVSIWKKTTPEYMSLITLPNGSANPLYSVAGTQYAIYAHDDTSFTTPLATMTAGTDGKSEVVDIPPGTYWIRETVASTNYELDQTPLEVTLTPGGTFEFSFVDTPVGDPSNYFIKKENRYGGDTVVPDAQFKLSYWASNAPSCPTTEPDSTTIFKTDANGLVDINSPRCYISGSRYYVNGDYTEWPVGWYHLEEIAAPVGYLTPAPGDVYVQWYSLQESSGSPNAVHTNFTHGAKAGSTNESAFNDPTAEYAYINEPNPIRGGLSVQKVDRDLSAAEDHGNTNLSGAEFTIVNASALYAENKSGVAVPTSGLGQDGTEPTYEQVLAAAETCTMQTITTDANGYAASGAEDLVYGTYYVIETKAPESTDKQTYYVNKGWVGKLVLHPSQEDHGKVWAAEAVHGKFKDTNSVDEPVFRGGARIHKYDLMRDLGIEHGDTDLSGAVFTIVNASAAKAVSYTDWNGTRSWATEPEGDVAASKKVVETCGLPRTGSVTYDQVAPFAADSRYVMRTLTTDAKGNAQAGKFDLPFGTYYIIETTPATGYFLNKVWVGRVTVNPMTEAQDGTIYNVESVSGGDHNNPNISDYVAAGDAGWTEAEWRVSHQDGGDDGLATRDTIFRGGVHAVKYDLDRDTPYGHGDADLSGAQFIIVNASDHAAVSKDRLVIETSNLKTKETVTYEDVIEASAQSTMQVITTDANGNAVTGKRDLPYGTYYMVCTAPPAGYFINKHWVGRVIIREDGKIYDVEKVADDQHHIENNHGNHPNHDVSDTAVLPADEYADREAIFRSGIELLKFDKELDNPTAQGIGTLGGAEFTIVNASRFSARNKADDDIATAKSLLGDHPTWQTVKSVAAQDKYTMQVITTNDDGYAVTDDEKTKEFALPYGTYYIIETKASFGYHIDTTFVGKIVVRDDGLKLSLGESGKGASGQSSFLDINDPSSAQAETVDEPVRRSDLGFYKLDDDGSPKAYIPFDIAAIKKNPDGSETVLEHHVVVSDEYGRVSTSADESLWDDVEDENNTDGHRSYGHRKHTYHTNEFDQYVVDGKVTEEGQRLLNEQGAEVCKWGIWFEGNSNGYTEEGVYHPDVNDTDGALYDCWYRVTEIQCYDNTHYKDPETGITSTENLAQSWPTLIYVYNDKNAADEPATSNNKFVALVYSLIDNEIRVESTAWDVASETKTVPAQDAVEVEEFVRYQGLWADHKYRLAVQWRDVTDSVENAVPLQVNIADPESPTHIDQREFLSDYANGGNTVAKNGLWVIREFQPKRDTDTNVTVAELSVHSILNTAALRGHDLQAVAYLFEYVDPDENDLVPGNWICVRIHPIEGDLEPLECLHVPDLKTFASDKDTGTRVGTKSESAAIKDHVVYSNVSAGEAYVIGMTLRDTATGEPIVTDEEGNEKWIYSKRIWRSGKNVEDPNYIYSDELDMPEFPVDSSKFDGNQSVTVIEALFRADEDNVPYGDPLVKQDSLLDEDETIRYPDVKTKALDSETRDDVGKDSDDAIVYDEVSLNNLIADRDREYVYKVIGHLVYQKDFTDANGVAHKEGDVVETLDGTQDVATVKVATDGTATFTYEDGSEAYGYVSDVRTIRNIGKSLPGHKRSDNTYPIDDRGCIMDVMVRMEYHVNSNAIAGGSVVAYEYLWHDVNGESTVNVAKHEEINDKGQTIHYPRVLTSAIDDATKDDVGALRENAVIVDTVDLRNLVPGRDYIISGRLMDQDSGEPLLVNGRMIEQVASLHITEDGDIESGNNENITVTSFDEVKREVCGTIDLVFTFDARLLENRTAVVFEDLYHKGVRVAGHNDLTDKAQSVHFPKIRTEANDAATHDHVGSVGNPTTLVDTVKYDNLVIGRSYKVSGVLMNKKTSEILLDVDGKEVRGEITFTAGEEDEAIGLAITNRDDVKNMVSGTVNMTFTYNGSHMEGVTVVAFEKLFHNDVELTSHEDIEDEGQTVHYPKVRTSALEGVVGDEVGENAPTHVVDTVRLWNLIPGMTYVVTGKLMDKDTGEALKENGEDVTATATVTVNADGTLSAAEGQNTTSITFDARNNFADGSVDLVYDVDATDLEGKTLVVFEDLYHNDALVDTHHDLKDLAQSIHFPKLRTTAQDDDTDDDVGHVEQFAEIIDQVHYTNLVIGRKYSIRGTLVYQDTGEKVVDSDGSYVTGYAEFFANKKSVDMYNVVESYDDENKVVSGTYYLRFFFDSRQLAGRSVVCFEDLYHNDVRVATHSDILDESQTIHYPNIHTTANDGYALDAVASVRKDAKIVDTVECTNLVPGKEYMIEGKLFDKETGDALISADGNEITTSRTFVAGEEDDGIVVTDTNDEFHYVNETVDITFVFDASNMEDVTAVAFEKLIHLGSSEADVVEVVTHEDIDDEAQTVHFPKVRTTAFDKQTNDEVAVSMPTTIVDSVKLSNLIPGMEYVVTGTLMNKDTKEAVVVDGEEVTKTITVSVTDGGSLMSEGGKRARTLQYDRDNNRVNGVVDIEFAVGGKQLENVTAVVFEELYHNDVLVASHADMSDEEQTVHFPKVRTEAVDVETNDHVGTVDESIIVRDAVTYQNLVIGKEYTLTGTLMNQATGLPVLNEDGTFVTAYAEFVAGDSNDVNEVTNIYEDDKEVDGVYTLEFIVDSRQLAGSSVVVFEDLYHNDVKVAMHAEITDESQTVHYPRIRTTATDVATGDHVGSIWGADINGVKELNGVDDLQDLQVIQDQIEVTNLVPGETYVIKGVLYDADASADAGEDIPVLIDGEKVTSDAVLTVSEDGSEIIVSDGCTAEVTDTNDEFNTVNSIVTVYFAFDSTKVTGSRLVAFESLYHDDVFGEDIEPDDVDESDVVYVHANIADQEQSVSDVDISTTASDKVTGDHVGADPEDMSSYSVITDEVHMAKLIAGMEYTIEGVLVELNASDLAANKVVYLTPQGTLTENRNEALKATYTFTAQSDVEMHNLNFAVASDRVQGMALTVFENLIHNDVVITTHPSMKNGKWNEADFKAQTVYYPTGKTNAAGAELAKHAVNAVAEQTIIDNVYFENLLVGEEYSISGSLMYQDNFVGKDGKEHSAGEKVAGTDRTVRFTASKDLKQASYDGSDEIAVVNGLSVHTYANGQMTVSGYIPIAFRIDASKLAGASTVASEEFYHGDVKVFAHSDITDKPQTVKIPEISTLAKTQDLDETAVFNEDGSPKTITITDTVFYKNIWTQAELDEMAGEGKAIRYSDGTYREENTAIYDIRENAEYIVSGILMDKETGEALRDAAGNVVRVVSDVFTPEANDGRVDIVFTVDASAFVKDGVNELEGKAVVAFEDLYFAPDSGDEPIEETVPIAQHHDINDVEQDIRFPKGRTHASDGNEADFLKDAAGDYIGAMEQKHGGESFTTDHEALASDSMTITDYVAFNNLHGATKYQVTGALQVVTETDESGAAISWEEAKDDAGNAIVQTVELDTTQFSENYDDYVSGYVPVVFRFSGLSLAGKTTVTFETITRDGKPVVVHADINDAPQHVFVPEIGTQAMDVSTGLDDQLAANGAYVLDKVTYRNLEKGKTYTLRGVLHDKAGGAAVPGAEATGTFVAGQDGQVITPDGTKVMTVDEARAAYGLPAESVQEAFTDAEGMGGAPAGNQIDTEADGGVGGNGTLDIDQKAEYIVGKDLPAGYYKITPGMASTGPFGYWCIYYSEDGVPSERTLAFTVANGIVDGNNPEDYIKVENDMVLQLAAWCNTGCTAVSATEGEGNLEAVLKDWYADREDAEGNASVEAEDSDKTMSADTLNGEAPEGASGDAIDNPDGQKPVEDADKSAVGQKEPDPEVAKSASSMCDRVDGEVYILVPIDSSALEGHTVVTFEYLYGGNGSKDGKLVARHEDINDAQQSVKIPKIRTHAVLDYEESARRTDKLVIRDSVSYENLTPGREYLMNGVLMDQATKESVHITAAKAFTPESANGTVELLFTLDRDTYAGRKLVAYEVCYTVDAKGDYHKVARHEDLQDAAQTVPIPKITTTAAIDGSASFSDAGRLMVVDKVNYLNLGTGRKYVLRGVLMDKETGKSTGVTAEVALEIVNSADGSVNLVFDINRDQFTGKTLVAFEKLFAVTASGKEFLIARHEDINDGAQTVYVPRISTSASIDGSKSAKADGSMSITDTVTYANLEAGRSYVVSGVVVDKATGAETGITAQKAFTPASSSGSVDLKFTFDSSAYVDKSLVVFERLATTNAQGETYVVAVHEDINDAAQTVSITKPDEPDTSRTVTKHKKSKGRSVSGDNNGSDGNARSIDTGDQMMRFGLLAGSGLLLLLLILLAVICRRRRLGS